MTYVDDATRMVKSDEGFSGLPYYDTEGYVTVGYGRALTRNPLTQPEAEFLLHNDISKCVVDLTGLPWFSKQTRGRKAALVNMRFNLGAKGFRGFKKMIAAIESKDYDEAAKQMLDSKWAKQVKGRAHRLAAVMSTGHLDAH